MSAKRVVVIEDDEDVRDFLEQALTRAEYEVTTAEDGGRGIRLCLKTSPDLVITDIVMPGRDGIETITEIRLKLPLTKIIAISGGGRYDSAEGYLEIATGLGADRALTKPVTRDRLLLTVKEVLAEVPGA